MWLGLSDGLGNLHEHETLVGERVRPHIPHPVPPDEVTGGKRHVM